MATNDAVNVNLVSNIGTGAFVGSIGSSMTTPNIGVATATTVTFNPTTNGPVGTTVGDNAGVGVVGEVVSAALLFGSATSLVSGTPKNILSISLTSGDWTIEGNLLLFCNTSLTTSFMYLNVNSALRPDNSFVAGLSNGSLIAQTGQAVVPRRIILPSTTTIFLIAEAVFTGTCNASGSVTARRMR